MPKEII